MPHGCVLSKQFVSVIENPDVELNEGTALTDVVPKYVGPLVTLALLQLSAPLYKNEGL